MTQLNSSVKEINFLKKQNDLMLSALMEYAKMDNWQCSNGGLFGDKWTRDFNGYDLARTTLVRVKNMQDILDRIESAASMAE